MPLDDKVQNQPDVVPAIEQPRQNQQGDFGKDAIDKGIDTENNGDTGTGKDVVGSLLNEDRSPKGSDGDLTKNQEAEDDPQANIDEQRAT